MPALQFRPSHGLLPAILLFPGSSAAQTVDPALWGADGNVLAIARSGNTVYIGGNFRAVGPNSGGGVPLSPTSGAPLRPYARVAGVVHAALSDGAGGWYIGGQFTAIEGIPRRNLAHILGDGTVSGWNPDADDAVWAIAKGGHIIYFGGWFKSVRLPRTVPARLAAARSPASTTGLSRSRAAC